MNYWNSMNNNHFKHLLVTRGKLDDPGQHPGWYTPPFSVEESVKPALVR